MNYPAVERSSAFTWQDHQVGRSVERILSCQDENGAFVASPDFAQYRYCWLRDGSFTAYALDRVGEHDAAARFHAWCVRAVSGVKPLVEAALARHRAGEALQASKMPPARFDLAGDAVDDQWPNFQMDGYGTWLWALGEHVRLSGAPLPTEWGPAVALASQYISELGTSPCFDVWEENGGLVHTTTLACVYSGLRAASRLLGDEQLGQKAEELRGLLIAHAAREGSFVKSDRDREVDGALLWLCEPLELVEPSAPLFAEAQGRIVAELELDGGVRRYAADTYYGGGAWPVLTASLGLCYAKGGDMAGARRCLAWVAERVDAEGRLGEQYGGEQRDPEHYRLWVERWGPPAADLVWSHAMYVLLAAEIASASGRVAQVLRSKRDSFSHPPTT
ncbi:MAG: glycoside hydrolase family 15 protein [Acidimicrobiales bacterium]